MAGAEGGAAMFLAARGADEGEVKVGVLELGTIGEDLINEKGDGFVIFVPIDRVACT